MPPKSISSLQNEALAQLATMHQEGFSEVAAVIPHYAGSWEVVARDAQTYIDGHPTEHALFVYEYSSTAAEFAAYIGSFIDVIPTIATIDEVAKNARSTWYDYVAAPEASLPVIRQRIAPHFLLRLTVEQPKDPSASDLVVPAYSEAGGRKLPWDSSDSIRLYRELYFAKGSPVSRQDFSRCSRTGESPNQARVLQNFDNSIQKLREAAGLDTAIYQRAMDISSRANYLQMLQHELGRVPSTEDIKLASAQNKGPSFETLVKGITLQELRQLAGQPETLSTHNKTHANTEEWTAADSARLYRQLSEQAGKKLTRKELDTLLTVQKPGQRASIRTFLAPFHDPEDPKNTFGHMQRAAGFEPTRIYPKPD